jgi:hypothetical protein
VSHHISHLGPGEELIDVDTFSEIYSRLAPSPRRTRRKVRVRPPRIPDIAELGGRPLPRPSSSPEAAALLEFELAQCRTPEAVAALGVHLAGNYASAVALLLVHRGMIQGLRSRGMGAREPALLFPADSASLFAEVVASGRPFRGLPQRRGPLDARILRVLGRQHVRELAVLPVSLRGRVVNLFYADNGSEPLGDASFAALGAVCARLASAYERLILTRKFSPERAESPGSGA